MRHKYETRGIVLARTATGEATAHLVLLTSDLGLVRARAQSVRRSGARLAASLATFAESNFVLVRGKEEWRIAGAVLEENWFRRLATRSARERAGRVTGLLLRLVAGEARDTELYTIMNGFFNALATLPEREQDAAEVLAALYLLRTLGLEVRGFSPAVADFSPLCISDAGRERAAYIARINNGIAASGL